MPVLRTWVSKAAQPSSHSGLISVDMGIPNRDGTAVCDDAGTNNVLDTSGMQRPFQPAL